MLEEKVGFWENFKKGYARSIRVQRKGYTPFGMKYFEKNIGKSLGANVALYFFPIIHPRYFIANTKKCLVDVYRSVRREN